MVGIAQIEARNALLLELVAADANRRRPFPGYALESNFGISALLHPTYSAYSGRRGRESASGPRGHQRGDLSVISGFGSASSPPSPPRSRTKLGCHVILWRWYTLPGPGEVGSDTWPAGTDHAMRGGASIWNTPALDPQLGLIYLATGNCGPDYDGSMREGDNLFCASMVALNAKTGEHVWHFQQVHHDIWDYDAASPVVLFDTVINGQPRKAIAEAGRTGWVYILDRTNGKPLVGI